jgi:hypothetical protein
MKKHIEHTDAVVGCRIDHYSFDVQIDTITSGGCFGQTLLKREPALQTDIHVPTRTLGATPGITVRPYPQIIHIPKNLQIQAL